MKMSTGEYALEHYWHETRIRNNYRSHITFLHNKSKIVDK